MVKQLLTSFVFLSGLGSTHIAGASFSHLFEGGATSFYATLQDTQNNATIAEDSTRFQPILLAPIIVAGGALIGFGCWLIRKYCCTQQCRKNCRPRCGNCRNKKGTKVFPKPTRSTSGSSSISSSNSTSSNTSTTPPTLALRTSTIIIPKLELSKINPLAKADPLDITRELTTIQEAPTSLTCQTKAGTRPPSFRTSLTQPQSQKTSPEKDKIDAARCEAAILNDPNLDPGDKLTRAAVTARYQVGTQGSPA
jgi:hypothetical protein